MELFVSTMDDLNDLCEFYQHVIKDTPGMAVHTKWVWGMYPGQKFIADAISRKEMYHIETDDKIVGAYVMTKGDDPDYSDIKWSVPAESDEIFVLHTLASEPELKGKGIGRFMLDRAVKTARGKGGKVLRLDTFLVNAPARRMYDSYGFHLCGQKHMPTSHCEPTDFVLYEYKL